VVIGLELVEGVLGDPVVDDQVVARGIESDEGGAAVARLRVEQSAPHSVKSVGLLGLLVAIDANSVSPDGDVHTGVRSRGVGRAASGAAPPLGSPVAGRRDR
jgi:hypothetical protein